jgi:tellurite resistance protein
VALAAADGKEDSEEFAILLRLNEQLGANA